MKREKLNVLSERDILIGLITSEKFCREICPVLNPRLLEIEYARTVASWIKEFYSNFKKAPGKDILKLYRAKCDEISDEDLQDNILTFVERVCKDYENIKTFNDDFALQQAIQYLKGRSLKNLNEDIDAYLMTGNITKAENAITKYKSVEKGSGEAVSLLHNTEGVVNSFTQEDELLFKFPGAYGTVIGNVHREDFISYLAPMKRGKCLAKGTKLLMADGGIKEVQDLVPGDKLMGPDSLPRNVEIVSKGFGKMYNVVSKVNPLAKNKVPEIDFTCNGAHILVLKNVWKCEQSLAKKIRKDGYRNGEITKNKNVNFLKQSEIEISVEDFLKLSNYQKQHFKLFRQFVDYKEVAHTISPRFIGIWLGDGTSSNCNITNIDKEIIAFCKQQANVLKDNCEVYNDKFNVKTLHFNNSNNVCNESNIHKEFKRLSLINCKHIPKEYLIDSRKNRLELLAGIIDTDGYASKDGKCCEISLMNKKLSEDVKTLCQQLGFRTKSKTTLEHYKSMYQATNGYKEVYTVQITGRLSEIPVLLDRKKMPDSKKYNSLNNTFSFEIRELGNDDYYGFVLDGDHRFLFADTTVSHNTFALIDAGVVAVQNGLKVLHVSLEMSEHQMLKRYWVALSGQLNEDNDEINYSYFEKTDNDDKKCWEIKHKIISRKAVSISDIEQKQKNLRRLFRGGDIRVLAVPAYSLTVNELENKIERLVQQERYIPDVIIVDYADIMAPSEKGDYRNQLDGIWKRLRGLAQSRKAVVFTASQSGRASIDKNADSKDIAEDIRKLAHITSMVALNQTPEEKKNGILRLKQLALREGEQEFREAVCTQCLSIGRIVTDSRFDDEVVDFGEKNNEDYDKKSSFKNKRM